jgi:hypothetical protein
MFICGSWKKVVEGPLHARRTLVYRCDMAEGHADEYHRDNVLAVRWLDADSDPECKPRNEWNNPPAPRATGASALYPIQRFRAAVSEGKNVCPIVIPNDKGPLVYYGEHRAAMDDLLNEALGPVTAEEMWKFHEGGRVDVLITAFLAARKLRVAPKTHQPIPEEISDLMSSQGPAGMVHMTLSDFYSRMIESFKRGKKEAKP